MKIATSAPQYAQGLFYLPQDVIPGTNPFFLPKQTEEEQFSKPNPKQT
jgi:hypothetical protein